MRNIIGISLLIAAAGIGMTGYALPGEWHQVVSCTICTLVIMAIAAIFFTRILWQFIIAACPFSVVILFLIAGGVDGLSRLFGPFAALFDADVALLLIAVACTGSAMNKYHLRHCAAGSACHHVSHQL